VLRSLTWPCDSAAGSTQSVHETGSDTCYQRLWRGCRAGGIFLDIHLSGTLFLTPRHISLTEDPANSLTSVVSYDFLPFRVSLSDLRSENPLLAQRLRHDPLRHLRALEAACHAIAAEERPGYDKDGK